MKMANALIHFRFFAWCAKHFEFAIEFIWIIILDYVYISIVAPNAYILCAHFLAMAFSRLCWDISQLKLALIQVK